MQYAWPNNYLITNHAARFPNPPLQPGFDVVVDAQPPLP
jgi:hypothetical protein